MTHPIYSSRKRTLAFVGAALAPFAVAGGLLALGLGEQTRALEDCNAGKYERCLQVASVDQSKITNPQHLQVVKEADERVARQVREESDRNAKIAKQDAERKQAAAKAEADFKAEGWWEQEPGIFVRWCGGDHGYCPGEESYQDYSWRAMVWCKERACGDIYARLNISQNGTVVGWTNETAYGGYGQKVVLTFGSHTRGSGRIVEFNARG